MINILFFVICLGVNTVSHGFSMLKDDLEVDRQVKFINKPPVKSIYTEYGDIVDCIDIYKQPAFDNPLLKGHKLQRQPSYKKSFERTSVKNSPTRAVFGLGKNKCPTGTVPIRRTTKDDLIRSKLILNDHPMMSEGDPGAHEAQVFLLAHFGPYYKVTGTNSIYLPTILTRNQTTSSYLWVQNGPIDTTNVIQLGWHVAPPLYGGDSATHIFSRWTSDSFKKTGCYNLQCSGFVQTHAGVYLGAHVNHTSMLGGETVEFTISIFQDENSKNWWLSIENQTFGYYPAALFSNMVSADKVGWGGRTVTAPGTPSPQMGSGQFPDGHFDHACYFRHISFQNGSRQDLGPNNRHAITFTDNSDCFGVEYYGDLGGDPGNSLQFGGPGGNCGD